MGCLKKSLGWSFSTFAAVSNNLMTFFSFSVISSTFKDLSKLPFCNILNPVTVSQFLACRDFLSSCLILRDLETALEKVSKSVQSFMAPSLPDFGKGGGS